MKTDLNSIIWSCRLACAGSTFPQSNFPFFEFASGFYFVFWCQPNGTATCSIIKINGTTGQVSTSTAFTHTGATTVKLGWYSSSNYYNGLLYFSFLVGTS